MGLLIKGLNFGTAIHTPHGWFRNGTEPSQDIKKHLTEVQKYELVPHKPNAAEEKQLSEMQPLAQVPSPLPKDPGSPLPIVDQNLPKK